MPGSLLVLGRSLAVFILYLIWKVFVILLYVYEVLVYIEGLGYDLRLHCRYPLGVSVLEAIASMSRTTVQALLRD